MSEAENCDKASSFDTATYFAGAERRESLLPSLDRLPFWLVFRESRREVGVPLDPPFARGPVGFFEPMGLAGLGLALELKAVSGSVLI